MTHRRWLAGLLVLLLFVGVGHFLWWYLPGERAEAPGEGLRPPGDRDELWLWIAQPHRNLARIGSGADEREKLLGAVARLADLSAPEKLPGFGPFPVPPSRELVLVVGEGGSSLIVEARIDPVLSLLSRLAGRVANNPWLAGGEVQTGSSSYFVEWSGTLWRAQRGRATPPEASSGPAFEGEALAAVRVSEDHPPIPAGTFVMRRSQGNLILTLDGSDPSPPLEVAPGELVLALLRGAGAGGPGGLLFFPGDPEPRVRIGGHSLHLPGVAAVRHPEAPPWDLPGQGVSRLIQQETARAEGAGWEIVSYSESQAVEAAALLEQLRPRVQEAESGRLELGAWLRPAAAEAEVGGLLELLGRLPWESKAERGRWRDLQTVLRLLREQEEISLIAGTNPPRFELVLVPSD